MRIGVVSVNLSFFGDLAKAFKDAGDRLIYYQPNGDDAQQIELLKDKCDVIFGEFAQRPIDKFLDGDIPVYVRTHRIEMYQPIAERDWSNCRIMFFSADHVKSRFINKTIFPPAHSEVSPTNLTLSLLDDRSRYPKKPYRMLMVGRWVPKKRVYTAIQLMAPRLISGEWEMWFLGSNNGSEGYGNTEYPDNVKDLINTLKINRQVRILGHIDGENYHAALRACDCIMSMSNEEGTHVGVAEAMAAGNVPFVHAWRGASKIYPNTFLTFDEFDRMLSAWEQSDFKQKLEASTNSVHFITQKGRPADEAKRVVDAIHRDVKEFQNN